jgi:hypothetical protein
MKIYKGGRNKRTGKSNKDKKAEGEYKTIANVTTNNGLHSQNKAENNINAFINTQKDSKKIRQNLGFSQRWL